MLLIIFLSILLLSSSKKAEWFDPIDQDWSFSSYNFFTFNDFIANDGSFSPSSQGLVTKIFPMKKTIAQSPVGVLDHVKNLFYHQTYWSVDSNEILRCQVEHSTQLFVGNHPFGEHVTDENNDLRLGACGLAMLDTNEWIVADFLQTNAENVPLYERLPFGVTETHQYESFTSVKMGVSERSKNLSVTDLLAIEYDRSNQKLTWLVNGKKVYEVDQIGYRDPNMQTLFYREGGEEKVDVPGFLCGIGCFTLLDMKNPLNMDDEYGLVRISPADSYTIPNVFFDEASSEESRLWGQGVISKANSFLVQKMKANDKEVASVDSLSSQEIPNPEL